ncbi:hypothetical protein Tco_0401199 [Tanacetum coccineum]
MVFHLMDTEEVSDRFVAPCFVKGMEVYDGEINLGEEDNMISKEYAVKLCLEHEVKRGNKVAKKELIVALKGKIYFVKFIINLDEDDVEPGVIFGRSFLRMTKEITDFGTGTITIYPDFDPFLEETEDEGKDMYDWDQLLDFNLDDIELLGEEELPPFVCKMGKSSRNKKKSMENLSLFYLEYRNTSTTWIYEQLGREEMKKVDRGITMINHTQAEVMGILTNIELDGKSVKEEEEAVKRVKGEALKEEDDLGAFIFPIRLEGHVNENALADRREDFNEACKLDEEIQHHLQMKWHGRTEVKKKKPRWQLLKKANEVATSLVEEELDEEVEMRALKALAGKSKEEKAQMDFKKIDGVIVFRRGNRKLRA